MRLIRMLSRRFNTVGGLLWKMAGSSWLTAGFGQSDLGEKRC